MAVVVSGASAHSATRRIAGAGPRTRFATLLRHRRCYAPRRRATAAAGTAAPLPRRGHRCQQLDPGAFRCPSSASNYSASTTALGEVVILRDGGTPTSELSPDDWPTLPQSPPLIPTRLLQPLVLSIANVIETPSPTQFPEISSGVRICSRQICDPQQDWSRCHYCPE